ncbi:MAG: Nif3-like dinuclear metal center hexameric protein, partial [Longimicrobiales bacterium]|nr:Nif3-like dinuclear metal center hexameric protein [Longimicrobiales bacterium]
VHLPLDAHAEVGNSAVLARELGVKIDEPFGRFQETPIGWSGALQERRSDLLERMEECLGREVHLIPGGPEELQRVAVVTGSGGSFIQEAADAGMDALITGEGKHHDFVEATELGVNVFYGGHYATETWGVRALAERLREEFSLSWTFIDEPSGL